MHNQHEVHLKAVPILEEIDGECEPIYFDIDWRANHSSAWTRQFCELLDAHKALLLSGFVASHDKKTESITVGTDLTLSHRPEEHEHLSVQDFADLLLGLDLTYYPYIGGAAPRTVIPVKGSDLPIVFTANESPPDQPIRKSCINADEDAGLMILSEIEKLSCIMIAHS